ncbi:MAG TPA: hypothetical protein VFY61_14645, partial [Pyrinomonadaceae bacterium]|nr:hypothetical protein [Pyrinomonadaceae bacterium]
EQAQAITVGPGEKLNDLVVRVPAKQPPSVVKISVVWADGSPVEKANLSIADVTQGEVNITHGMETDAQGQATLDGYVGQKLVISARSNRAWVPSPRNEPMEKTDSARLTLERPTHTVRIVITKIR